MKMVICQRVVANYRYDFFTELSRRVNFGLIYGQKNKHEYIVENINDFEFDNTVVKNLYFLGGVFWWQIGIINALRKYSADVVIISPTPRCLSNFIIIIYCKLSSKKIIGWGMGKMPGRNKYHDKLHSFIQWPLIRMLDGMICYSESAQNYYASFGLKNISIAPNAVTSLDYTCSNSNRETHSKCNKMLKLIYIGQLTPLKHVDKLIKIVLSSNKFELNIVGSGADDYVKYLEGMSLGSKKVNFSGHLEGRELYTCLVSSDIFVLPSLGGLAINHAMEAGLPVLVSEGDGTEKSLVIEGKTGFYFNRGDWDHLESKLNLIEMDKGNLPDIGKNGRQHIVDNFSLYSMVNSFITLSEELI